MKRSIFFLIAVYGLTVALMALQKPLFLLFYTAQTAAMGDGVWWQVVAHGLSLDLTMAGYVTALPLLILLASLWIPLSDRIWRAILLGWFVVISLLTAAIVAADLGLYGYWGFRIDSSIFIYLSDPKEAAASVSLREWVVYMAVFVTYAALMITAYYFVLRILRIEGVRYRVLHTGSLLLLGGLCFLSIRGGVSVATANVSKVYFSDRLFLNHAAVNPVFSLLSTLGDHADYASTYPFFEETERATLFQPISGVASSERAFPALLTTTRPNVVIVILESFARTLMDEQVAGQSVMPNMQRLKGEGIWFENFFANSYRTDRGEVAILNGFPAQTKMSIMKLPTKSQTLPSIARSLGREGYASSFTYGGNLNFTNQASYMYGTGWQKLIWQKDMHFDAPTSKWGYADDVVTAFFGDQVLVASASEKPFLAGLLTLSSHEPFDVPYSAFDNKILNAVAFTDACVGQLIDKLKASPAWDNLLVILVADHAYNYPQGLAYNSTLRHRIPMLWLGGAVKEPLTVATYASQMDIAATLLAQMHIDHADYAYSKNIFSVEGPKFGYWCFNEGFGVADATGETIYDCTSKRILTDTPPPNHPRLDWGKVLLQTTYKDISER
ncbi:MAG: LTA synthase family protein [Alistipes sp.]